MNPFTFLSEECASVRAALNETLRHDYGPERSLDYFNECKKRLDSIQEAIDDDPNMDGETIAAHMRSLSALGSRISLIERSHLGEFSWPFAEIIREVAQKLFVQKELDESSSLPIVHVIAEGMHYQIVDDVLPLIGEKRIIVVAFPRQLKHHVLLHSIFGHELGHTAINSSAPGEIITMQVVPALIDQSPLKDQVQLTAWLKRDDAPAAISAALKPQQDYVFPLSAVRNWRIEIVCDLFGLLLFGPAFAAALRTILESLSASSSDLDLAGSTHPPFSIRRRVITSAMKVLGWHTPVTTSEDGPVYEAEKAFLEYAVQDEQRAWALLISESQLKIVLERLSRVFAPHTGMAFDPPDRNSLVALARRITLGRPPIIEKVSDDGSAKNARIPTSHCLYAGWTFWFGRKLLRHSMLKQVPRLPELTFLQINRLCEYAMLQQRAINAAQSC